jgi:hypothetical protein
MDDSETGHKLRSTQQFLLVVQQRRDDLDRDIERATSDEEILDVLRGLGDAV